MARTSVERIPILNRFDDELPQYEPYERADEWDAPLDSEIDFDDEAESDQLTMDIVEALEVGAWLDDPEDYEADFA